ncbi:MAG TPA: hypothetical protein VFD10_08375 [Atribacterota bacterium]|nr:hypothetical protein [Atribacterota bacterium]
MNKKKIFTWLGIGAGILTLSTVLLVGDVSSAFSDSITGKSSKYTEKEYAIKDLAIKTFNLETNKVKPLFTKDIFDEAIAKESSDTRMKTIEALSMLTKEKIFNIGDSIPVYFLEENNIISIAIEHADGTISIDKFDISGKKPVRTDHKSKGVKQ